MKKFIVPVLLGTTALAVAACGGSSTENISFDDAYHTLLSSYETPIDKKLLLQTLEGNWKSESDFTIKTDMDTTTGGMISFTSDSVTNQDTLTTSGTVDLQMKGTRADGSLGAKISLALKQALSNDMPIQYIKLTDFSVDTNQEMPELAVAKAVAGSLTDKWLKIDLTQEMSSSDFTDFSSQSKNLLTNLVTVNNNIKSYTLLENLGQTTYKDEAAYHVAVNDQEVHKLVADIVTGTLWADQWNETTLDKKIEGLLLIKDAKDVSLLINNIEGMSGTSILFEKGGITIDTIDESQKIKVAMTKKSADTYDVLLESDDEMTDVKIAVNITLKVNYEAGKVDVSYNGMLNVMAENLKEMIGTDTAQATINGSQVSTKIDEIVEVAMPTDAEPLTEVIGQIMHNVMVGSQGPGPQIPTNVAEGQGPGPQIPTDGVEPSTDFSQDTIATGTMEVAR